MSWRKECNLHTTEDNHRVTNLKINSSDNHNRKKELTFVQKFSLTINRYENYFNTHKLKRQISSIDHDNQVIKSWKTLRVRASLCLTIECVRTSSVLGIRAMIRRKGSTVSSWCVFECSYYNYIVFFKHFDYHD